MKKYSAFVLAIAVGFFVLAPIQSKAAGGADAIRVEGSKLVIPPEEVAKNILQGW